MKKSASAFTIVELLIVIVVIGILATITVISYTGVQRRAYDTRRQSDISTITTALELYKISSGGYPTHVTISPSPPPYGDWEFSIQDNFLQPLNVLSGASTPTDPANNTINYYRYHLYGAGQYGCDPDKGKFYVMQVIDENNTDPNQPLKKSSPGFACPDRDWSLDGGGGLPIMYTTGRFENS